MKERISDLVYDLAVLTVVGLAAFGGQVLANHVPLFGKSPVVNRLDVVEQRQADLQEQITRKIGF